MCKPQLGAIADHRTLRQGVNHCIGNLLRTEPKVATSDGRGYWSVAADGGVFSFGDAGYLGSEGAGHINAPVVAAALRGSRPL